jgi:protein-L-isoaspartate(D-aspartate) O-methyltransferase
MPADFARARAQMIESQIRPNDVTDAAVVGAFRLTAKELYLPPSLRPVAYTDAELELAPGRFVLRPRDHAKLIQACAPRPKDRVLEIGAGWGYGAAVLSHICASVVALEPEPDMALAAAEALKADLRANVQVVTTNIQFGWADHGPYDVILVHGAVEVIPQSWLDQLAEGGRLGVIVRAGAAGTARLYLRAGGLVSYRTVFDAAPPVLPGMEQARAFQF